MRIDPSFKKKLRKHVTEKIAEEDQMTVVLQTPFPLSSAERELIFAKFPQLRSLSIQNEVKKDLIGGFILKYRSKIIDASLKTKIMSVVNSLITQ